MKAWDVRRLYIDKRILPIKVTLSFEMFSFFPCSADFCGILLQVLSLKIRRVAVCLA